MIAVSPPYESRRQFAAKDRPIPSDDSDPGDHTLTRDGFVAGDSNVEGGRRARPGDQFGCEFIEIRVLAPLDIIRGVLQ